MAFFFFSDGRVVEEDVPSAVDVWRLHRDPVEFAVGGRPEDIVAEIVTFHRGWGGHDLFFEATPAAYAAYAVAYAAARGAARTRADGHHPAQGDRGTTLGTRPLRPQDQWVPAEVHAKLQARYADLLCSFNDADEERRRHIETIACARALLHDGDTDGARRLLEGS